MVTEKKRTCSCSSSADLAVLSGDQAAVLGRMEEAVEVLLRGLGEDPTREGLRDTPRRVAKAWLDIASGYTQECTRAFGKALFHEPIVSSGSDGLVVVRDITFAALCEHTLLPFHGRCHIAYVPRDGVVLGLSKLARVTKCLASRLQRQEAFTHNLVEAVQREVGPHGVAVVVQANHLGGPCPPQTQLSSAACGCFQDSRNGLLTEFLTLLRLSGVAAAGELLSSLQQGQAAAVAQLGSVDATAPLLQQLGAATRAQQRQVGAVEPPAAAVRQQEGGIAGVSVMDMAAAVKALLEGVGEEPSRQGLKGSAERYVQWLFASTAGSRMPPTPPTCSACTADAAASEDELSCGPDLSPEPPATPADQSPDASCASSDVAPDEPLPCSSCLVSASSPMQAEVVDDLLEEAAGCQLGLGQGQQHQQDQQRQLAGLEHPSSCGHAAAVGGSHSTSLALQQQLQGQLGAGSGNAAAAGRVHTFCTQFASQCEHHLLPFYGTLRLAYQLRPAAEGRGRMSERGVAGQLRHIVERYSKRLQVQERLSHQVADAALAALGAASVLVVVDSAHMCMVARGVEKHASSTLTTASRGLWAGDSLARARAMGALLAQ